MKLLHLSDLHIGKRVNEFSMLDDQRYILSQIIDAAERIKPDAVAIAGDLYDKPVPSAEAVALCDCFLSALADGSRAVLIISGNHDSAERIAFGSELMKKNNVFVSPVYSGKITPVTLSDEFGEIDFYLLPFVRPPQVRAAHGTEAASYNEAFAEVIERLETDRRRRRIAVAHQFITGAVPSQSEELSLGGIDNVDAAVFDGFCYAALGHIHRAQRICRDEVRYCGTPLKYSFSETGQKKSITLAEIDGEGNVKITLIPLEPIRDMREIRGSFAGLTSNALQIKSGKEDYLLVTLTDSEDIPDAVGKLRSVYPNIMQLRYDNARTKAAHTALGTAQTDIRSPLELFSELYQAQNGSKINTEQEKILTALISEIWEEKK